MFSTLLVHKIVKAMQPGVWPHSEVCGQSQRYKETSLAPPWVVARLWEKFKRKMKPDILHLRLTCLFNNIKKLDPLAVTLETSTYDWTALCRTFQLPGKVLQILAVTGTP